MNTKEKMTEYLHEQVIEDLESVEKFIFENIESEIELMGDISRYLIVAGGKRVRPALVLLTFRAVGGKDIQKVVPIAAAIELIHTATLIHDDINDSSATRRGIPSVNQKFGLSNALVGGDFLFVKAFKIGGSYDWGIVKIIADACSNLAEGEILQSMNRYNANLNMEDYNKTIEKKTASLISACAQVGAILGGAREKEVRALSSYGRNMGLTFQIIDDILDLEGDAVQTGKPQGTDIMEGQLSVPLIKALSVLEPKTHDELAKILKKKENTKEEIERAIDIVRSTDALPFTRDLAKQYADKARAAIGVLPDTDYKDNLELFIDALIERNY
ncbi:MAG: polyprenyl synthetase family protein [Methanomassiliicoccales archaeon]|nr:MAG: polyprenyl synthetase family protein [Methanomassiliicoccales archaeon]